MLVPSANVPKESISSVTPANKKSDVVSNQANNRPDESQGNAKAQQSDKVASTSSKAQANNQAEKTPSSCQNSNKAQSFSNVMSKVLKEKEITQGANANVPIVDVQQKVTTPVDPSSNVFETLGKFIKPELVASNDDIKQESKELLDNSLSSASDSDPKGQPGALVASMMLTTPDNVGAPKVENSVFNGTDPIDANTSIGLGTPLAKQEGVLEHLKQNLPSQNEILEPNKEAEKPVAAPLSAALSNLSSEQTYAKNDPKFEAALDGSEAKVDDKFAKPFLSLKEDKSLDSEVFLKQLQAQMQPKQSAVGSNISQPQMVVHSEHLASSSQLASQTIATDPASVKSLQIETPVGQGQWSKEFNDHVAWLSSQKVQAASIKLTPTDLGPVEINLKISNDVASIQFHSHSPQVRELIEQALPKLRDQLAEQGIQLSDANVSDNNQQQQMMARDNNANGENHFAKNDFFKELHGKDTEEPVMISEITQKTPQGLIDYFA